MAHAVSVKVVEKLISGYGISRSQAVQIVNIAPTTIEELKSVYDTKMTNLTDDKLMEIVDLIVKNRS